MSANWDVVVVGARLAGASTAMLLARAGLRVLCLERARPGTDTVSTHALMRGGVLQLSRWGVLDGVVAAGTPPVRRSTFHYGAESVSVTVRPGFGVDALYAPRRTLLDRLLVDAATAAGAVVRHRTAVTGLLRDPRGRVAGVVTRDSDGAVRQERAGLVVGADGRTSVVARAVDARSVFQGRTATALVYGYRRGATPDGYVWTYGTGVSGGAIPTGDGLTCVFTGTTPGRMTGLVRDLGPERALAALAGEGPLGPLVTQSVAVGPVRHVRGAPAHLRRASGDGWALVGDAGYWKDPLSTHGMTAALRDAELLSRAVLDTPGGGAQRRDALRGWEAQRDALSLPMLHVVERIASHDWEMEEVRALLMSMASVMTDEIEVLAGLPSAA